MNWTMSGNLMGHVFLFICITHHLFGIQGIFQKQPPVLAFAVWVQSSEEIKLEFIFNLLGPHAVPSSMQMYVHSLLISSCTWHLSSVMLYLRVSHPNSHLGFSCVVVFVSECLVVSHTCRPVIPLQFSDAITSAAHCFLHYVPSHCWPFELWLRWEREQSLLWPEDNHVSQAMPHRIREMKQSIKTNNKSTTNFPILGM